MLSIGRIFAGDGWRYLWEQVAAGVEDYYLADVARGERPGRWGGRAAAKELGLTGEVTEEQMRRVFGRLMDPVGETPLGGAARSYRTLQQRLEAARNAHDRAETTRWAARELALLEAGASPERIDAERTAARAGAGERWAVEEARIRRGGERKAVAGFDLTFSPPKSVSVLWAAAPPEGRQKIWAAHHEGVAAAMGYVEREAALSRSGYAGVRQVDTTGLVTASFDHRMSRTGDVHIHTHTAVLNRVRCADDQWRSLDGRALYRVAAAAGAIYDRVRETALERDLGVRHQEDKLGGAPEIIGVDPDVRRVFSGRRVQIEGRLADLVAEWTAEHGSEPSPWLVTRMAEWARQDTRPSKSAGETTTAALDRWDRQTKDQLGHSLRAVWVAATNPPNDIEIGVAATELDDNRLLAGAVAAVEAAKSTWTRYDLAREVTRRIRLNPATGTAECVARVNSLVHAALADGNRLGVISLAAPAVFTVPSELRRSSDKSSFYDLHGATRYTTNLGLAAERRLLRAAADVTAGQVPDRIVEDVVAAGDLDGDQADAARAILTSGRRVEAMVGPAGTGKTTTMAAVARAWAASGGQVLGVSVAENAARILANAARIPTVNAAKLIFEHTQRTPREKTEPWWKPYAITAGALVILDEAGMASRHTIDTLATVCAGVDAKLLLVGDPEQLDSPDAGGAFDLIATQVGAVHLAQVRRFHHAWEAKASLRLRTSNPAVLADYDRRGRITGGTDTEMEDAALRAAVADRGRGLRVYLLAETNETAARLAGRIRDHLVTAGAVDDARTVTLADGNRVGVGDEIVTRRNDRTHRSGDGRFVANRDTWTVTALTPAGGVRVSRLDHHVQTNADTAIATAHEVELDGGYVAEHVQLDYAATVHAAQGSTRDVAHTVLAARSSRHGVYTALTRGRAGNYAYVICGRPEGADRDGPTTDPIAVLAGILEQQDRPENIAALTVQADEANRAESLARLFPIWQDLIADHTAKQTRATLLAVVGPDLAAAALRSPAWPTLTARLRRLAATGIDPAIALADAASGRPLDDADDLAAVLDWRLHPIETAAPGPVGDLFGDLTPIGMDPWTVTAAQVAGAMDARTHALAVTVETELPAWADVLGPIPDHEGEREAWRARAGIVAGYREAFAITTPDDPLGPRPPTGRPEAHAWWTRAAAALDPNDTVTLAGRSAEHLEAVVDRARATLARGPEPVADQLRRTALALRHAHTDHGLALAHHQPGDEARHRAERLAHELDQLEEAQARREHWTVSTACLAAEADAAQGELDRRCAADRTASPSQVDTATLADQLHAARIRAERAATAASTQERRAEEADRKAEDLRRQIAVAEATRPASAAARRQVLAEQTATARIIYVWDALDRTRLGIHRIRGQARADLTAEFTRLRYDHPGLTAGDPTARWATLIAAGETADREHLHDLTVGLDQAQTDSTWCTLTATQLRAQAEQEGDAITAVRTELIARTGRDVVNASPRPPVGGEHRTDGVRHREHNGHRDHRVHEHLAYQQVTGTVSPSQPVDRPPL